MPPLPRNARISSCGNNRATSSTPGGWNGAVPGGAAVSAAAPCLNRQAGQSPASTPDGSGAPHCGQFFPIFWLPSDSFIHPPPKRISQNVTRIMCSLLGCKRRTALLETGYDNLANDCPTVTEVSNSGFVQNFSCMEIWSKPGRRLMQPPLVFRPCWRQSVHQFYVRLEQFQAQTTPSHIAGFSAIRQIVWDLRPCLRAAGGARVYAAAGHPAHRLPAAAR